MSLFRSTLRPPAILTDDVAERYLAAIQTELEPDPLFRRRLRGHLVNRFVAAREDLPPGGGVVKREMTRIARAVLYASFLLGLSVSSVMAASQRAIPGEILYPLKRQIEEIRLQVVPAHLQDELAVYRLGQRIEELHRLIEAGQWELVTSHAEAVERVYEAAMLPGGRVSLPADGVTVATGLIEQLPDVTRMAVEGAMSGLPGIGQDSVPGASGSGARGSGSPDGGDPGDGNPGGGDPGGGRNAGTDPNGTTNPGESNNDGSSGNAPGHAPANSHPNAVDLTRGGAKASDTADAPASMDAVEEADVIDEADAIDEVVETRSPTKSPRPTRGPSPSAFPPPEP